MNPRPRGLAYIRDLRRFGEEKLSLQFDGSFRRYVSQHRTANWLYVVHPDHLASALPGSQTFRFTWKLPQARRWRRYYRDRGYHTYLYSAEAHGGSRCPITPSLLEATPARQGYVVLHEAWHASLRLAHVRLPYALEEATGRVVGVFGVEEYARQRGDTLLLREAGAQARAWLALARFVNRTCRRLRRFYVSQPRARDRRTFLQTVQREADHLRASVSTAWEHEELGREMNNAFFFRYRDYTRFYPLALRVLKTSSSLPRAMRLYMRAGRQGAVTWLTAYARNGGVRG